MSFHVEASGVNGSGRVGACESEDDGKDNTTKKTCKPCSKPARHRLECADPAEEGGSNSGGQLMRPTLPGRKAHKKSCSEDNKGRKAEQIQSRDEEGKNVELVVGRKGGKQSQRKTTRTGKHEDVAQNSTESLSGSNSDIQLNSTSEHLCPKPGCSRPGLLHLKAQSPHLRRRVMSSDPPQPPIQTSSTSLSPPRFSSRTSTGDLQCSSSSLSREPDRFWVKVRTEAAAEQSSPSHHIQTHIPSLTSPELGDEEEGVEVEDVEEESRGVMEVMSQTVTLVGMPPCVPFGERRMTKREKNRIKCLRRKQRRRERWRQSQQESRQSSTGNPSSSSSEEEEDTRTRDRDGYICAVCLDVYFSPYMCHPCNHIFCEPCLRTLAKNSPTNTPCPLCRTVITHVFFQKELNQTAKTFFPKEYLSRFQRQSSPIARRQFPHGGGYRMDPMDFEDHPRGWRFDMDMVIIYIYSVNWVIGFLIFCFLCYLFFPSF
ncbi:hypothetical protein Q5P01_014339 [Channa striata]|uniref:E3 ubiquitin-protein ligase RNF180 n=1 Tax=Channa striata TaxID=64152 RepID=A0AA88SHM3_CHASR|nr:hypothetical protein Q5P01_014339 [Channa striata]